MQWHHIQGLTEFRSYRDLWNQLWASGHSAQPTAQAEGIENWCKHFAVDRDFSAIVVEHDEQLVAGIPLLKRTKMGLPIFELPVNCWANSGDLLLNPKANPGAIGTLVDGLQNSLAGMLRLEEIAWQSERWNAFLFCLQEQGGSIRVSRSEPVAIIDDLNDWDRYQASLSSNYRRTTLRQHRRLLDQGELTIRQVVNPTGKELDDLLKRCFEIEDMGWKGEAGTSVLKTPGMFEYFADEARIAQEAGVLRFWLLELDAQIIAFEYCHIAREFCFGHKLSFDPAFAKFGPGRVLRHFQLEQYAKGNDVTTFDLLGVMCDAKKRWANATYQAGSIVATLGSPLTKTLLRAYNTLRPPACGVDGEQPITQ